jgi:crotonobetainyl-CoA:carnitine CoA-transferase CaiB-like acyl-CoA transferase
VQHDPVEPLARVFARSPAEGDIERWAASGAMALTGHPTGTALLPPASLVPAVVAMGDELAALTERQGHAVELDTLALLAERAAFTGVTRQGRRSCGGAAELWRAADGWVAVSLPRPDDVELLPAWLGVHDPDEAEAAVAARSAAEVVAAGAELGLAVASMGEVGVGAGPAVQLRAVRSATTLRPLADVVVVDLSSLWAGPLAGHLLRLAGARVVKVESIGRPDGARRGPLAFFDLLHAGQESVALDLDDPTGAETLRRLVSSADVVIEASRPRALRHLGVGASAEAARGAVWLSITGYGRDGEGPGRTAFGDDAAVAGGLVGGPSSDPVFCADAIADPLSGLLGTIAVLACLSAGRSAVIDLAMSRVAAWCSRSGPMAGAWSVPVAPPRTRPSGGTAAPLGADTDAVVAALAGS